MWRYTQTGAGLPLPGVRRPHQRLPSGFTVLELLSVLAVILILTVLFWNWRPPKPDRMRACARNLEKIYLALQVYANDYRGRFPVYAGASAAEEPLNLLVPRYTIDTGIFICPASRDTPLPASESIRNRTISYAYYMGQDSTGPQYPLMSDRQVDSGLKPAGAWVFSASGGPPGNNHGTNGGNFLFCDGSVQSTPAKIAFSLVVPQGVTLLNPKPSEAR